MRVVRADNCQTPLRSASLARRFRVSGSPQAAKCAPRGRAEERERKSLSQLQTPPLSGPQKDSVPAFCPASRVSEKCSAVVIAYPRGAVMLHTRGP